MFTACDIYILPNTCTTNHVHTLHPSVFDQLHYLHVELLDQKCSSCVGLSRMFLVDALPQGTC